MSLAEWSLFVGALLVTMVLAGTLLARLPLSSAMVYLALGWLLGPAVMDVLRPDPYLHADVLERLAEVALLISLFAVGLRLGVPLRDQRWRLPLQRVRERPRPHTRPLAAAADTQGHSYETLATHSHHASATMRGSVQGFNEQLEKLAELALVLVVGAMLAYAKPLPAVWWFVPLLLLVLRPLSAVVATAGEQLTVPQRAMIGWFGIRGIGSVFYLLFALSHGIDGRVGDTLVSLTLWSVAASIVAHGLTAQPLMRRYLVWRRRAPKKPAAGDERP